MPTTPQFVAIAHTRSKANQRQYEQCFVNRKDAFLVEQRGRDWEFKDEKVEIW